MKQEEISRNIENSFREAIETKKEFLSLYKNLLIEAINKTSEALKKGNKLLICGNGGSAADATHFSGELVGRFYRERKALPAISLSTNISSLTAIANDYGYQEVFRRQVVAHGRKGDILYAISTSGNSLNIIKAVEEAKKIGMFTIGFLGKDGGKLKKMVDLAFVVSSNKTPRIQEIHELLYHIICEEVEKLLFPG